MLAPDVYKGLLEWEKESGMAFFHSISAFCNAGFDLMGVRQQYSSLTYYAGNGLVNAVIVLLILTGGLGFLTWEDIKTNKTAV